MMLLFCDKCGVVVRESENSRHESDECEIGYAPRTSPGQFYRCDGRLQPVWQSDVEP